MKPTINQKGLPDTAGERTVFTVLVNAKEIHIAISMSFGLTAWFKAYTQSDEFAQLSKEWKAESFEAYEGLRYVLESIEEDTNELQKEFPKFG